MRLIIDTDAGVDDAQAIMMALAHPEARVEAITTVTGNVHVEWVIRNVFTVLDLMGASVPVYRGADQPLLPGQWQPEAGIHGQDGLGDYRRRPATTPDPESEAAAVALVRLANEAPGEYTLVALGPLTNIALACRLDPTFPEKIARFVFMGGTISAMGNTRNVSAEFNIFCDPEAAQIVLAAFSDATMLSWETTLRHPFLWDAYDALTVLPSHAARFFLETTAGTVSFIRQFPHMAGYLLPDPLAMAAALDPQAVKTSERYYVTVELQGAHTRGQTVIDYFGLLQREPNVTIITEMDVARVYTLYQRMLA